jgi:aldehyde:ferredoxin oxidoreductase
MRCACLDDAKSPLTGTIKESNAGGTSVQQFACMGIKALIIEGLPKEDKYYSLNVTVDGVTIAEETELVGKGNFAVIDSLCKKKARRSGS